MFDILFLTHPCHFNWLFQSSSFLGLRVQVVPSPNEFVCSEPGSHWWYVPDAFTSLINEYGRKIVWEKQFLRRHNNSCPHFSHPLKRERRGFDCLSCAERYAQTPTWLLCANLFHFSYSGWMYLKICQRIMYALWTCLYVWETDWETKRSSGRFHYLRFPFHPQQTHSSV